MLLLYLRVFSITRMLRFAIYVALFMVVTSHIVAFFITTMDVQPIDCHWKAFQTDADYFAHCKEPWDDAISYVFIGAFTVVLDLVILAIPCPAVWKLNMPKRQKIGVILIFSTGLLCEPFSDQG